MTIDEPKITEPLMARTTSLDMPADSQIQAQADLFGMASEFTRLKLLYGLATRGEMGVSDLCELTDQPHRNLSHHLALLRAAGIIEHHRRGYHGFYAITGRGRGLLKAVSAGSARPAVLAKEPAA